MGAVEWEGSKRSITIVEKRKATSTSAGYVVLESLCNVSLREKLRLVFCEIGTRTMLRVYSFKFSSNTLLVKHSSRSRVSISVFILV